MAKVLSEVSLVLLQLPYYPEGVEGLKDFVIKNFLLGWRLVFSPAESFMWV
jgi:hypothetical protein